MRRVNHDEDEEDALIQQDQGSCIRNGIGEAGEQDRAAHRLECPDCADASPAEFGACGIELRTLEQRQADALCALIRGEIGGLCPEVNVTVSLDIVARDGVLGLP